MYVEHSANASAGSNALHAEIKMHYCRLFAKTLAL